MGFKQPDYLEPVVAVHAIHLTKLKLLLSPPVSFPCDADVSLDHRVMKYFKKSQLEILAVCSKRCK